MADKTADGPPRALSRAERMQLVAVEPVLNRLAVQGLRVRPVPSGAWCWEWQGHSGVAPGWGSAITAAICWYSGLAPDARPEGEGISDQWSVVGGY